ncbi:MAG: radical SAM protein [Cryomorphaceae bacterium]|nr:radical SAM protein [Cryomorphaceae bacterium]
MAIKQDIQTQIRVLTLRRIWNASLLYASYHIARLTKRPVIWGKPFSISAEPTTACNLGCPECPSGLKKFSRPTGKMDPALFATILNELHRDLAYITFYFQGEPYLHPQFTDLVLAATAKNIYSTTSTNAHFLTPEMAKKTVESGLSRLIISIDGTTQEVYEQYRVHGSLDKVIAGTKNIIAAKKALNSSTPHIIFQFLVVKPNEHQIADVHQLAADLGVEEVRLKTAQIYDYENGSDLIPENENYSRYRQQANGKWTIKNRLLNQCWRMWQGCVITWDGKIVPCCFDKDAQHTLGNIAQGFGEVWKSEQYTNFRKAILTGRSEIDICTNCTEGTKVWGESVS